MSNLKELRKSKGVSQQAVADYLEITRQAYSHYENGTREPNTATLLKLAAYFNTTIDNLLLNNPHTNPITDDELKSALFNAPAAEITDDMLKAVKNYAGFLLSEARKNSIEDKTN